MMNIDRKAVRLGLKNGFGFKEFYDKYGLNQESLSEAMFTLYKNNKDDAKKIMSEIASNEKKNLKKPAKPVTEYKGVPIEEFKHMSMDEFMKIENGDKGKSKMSEESKIEDEIAKLSDELVKLEGEGKKWLAKHHTHQNKLKELDESLQQIEEKAKSLKKKFDSIIEYDAVVVEKANENLEKRRQVQGALEEKRQKLMELKRIVICAYTDGSVALMDDSRNIELNDTGCDELYLELVQKDECQELRAKEIRALAKLLKVKENHSSLDFEVICDTSEMEAAFRQLEG